MCRLYGFIANEPTKVECTLVYAQNALLLQSWSDQRGVRHADGWGIGYYEDGTPALVRRKTAAFEDAHFGLAASRVHARAVLAHIRLATVGQPSLENTHPFSCGRWTFAHNGTIRGFETLRPRLDEETDPDLRTARRGTTDSETAFYWILTRMRRAGIATDRTDAALPALVRVMTSAVATLAEWSESADDTKPPRLNFLLTNGHVLLASRWNHSLYWVERTQIHDCEICGIPHVDHQPGTHYRAVILASEPVSGEDSREVDDHGLIAVDDRIETHQYAIGN